MLMLIKIGALTGGRNDTADATTALDVGRMLQDEIQEIDPELYEAVELHVRETVFGQVFPEPVVEHARKWNDAIRADLSESVKIAVGSQEGDPLKLDSLDTRRIALAALVADGEFRPAGNRGICSMPDFGGAPVFGTVMTDHMLKDVESSPETYVLLAMDVTGTA